ncbi:hypothetical protein Nepgr_022858 [Nepenthes gracilis]|uniref:Uncharacterized protein n=1 Tax=Nepenthes gracilis TaxID=150966 RepID=A0AAD3XYT6_NEPGR|nr:hypothetical protein Nepgr_022858 [Nepenthes gracilis]
MTPGIDDCQFPEDSRVEHMLEMVKRLREQGSVPEGSPLGGDVMIQVEAKLGKVCCPGPTDPFAASCHATIDIVGDQGRVIVSTPIVESIDCNSRDLVEDNRANPA